MLAETLNHMAVELREAQRLSIERERLAREMELARNLQRSLLPADRHQAGDFGLVGAQVAAAEVGGDYFDVVPLENGRIGFAIADVAGKGIGGCLIMTMLSALLRGLRDRYESPAALLVAIDRSLSASLPRGGFVTMTYGTLDPESGSVSLASAGHLPAILYRAANSSIEWYRAKSVPIGALRKGGIENMLSDETVTLGPGDLLVQITDGYHEAPAPGSGELFEFARIETIVCKHGAAGPEAVIRALDAAVREWSPGPARDDQTILVVGREGFPVRENGPPDGASRLTEPLALLQRLQREGGGLSLEPRLEELARIRGWLRERASRPLDPSAERLIVSALYETCANVIEHGFAGRRGTPVDVWWLVPEGDGITSPGGGEAVFVIRDRGASFDLSATDRAPFDDSHIRTRRRGLGLEMIQRITSRVAYAGGTPEGNVTVLEFNPERLRDSQGDSIDDRSV
jgi:serine phosphatase RsbU (regulator of sigma subunit)/anti-sigma regulatory factor (Ser/Thr protein kinase)